MITASRYHDFSAGHKVTGHENKCAHLHGHNYRVHFTLASAGSIPLDLIGRVIDFSCIKELLCEWLEENWDHKFLICINDPLAEALTDLVPDDIVMTNFNPPAENMAQYLVDVVAPKQLAKTCVELVKCEIEETRKCSVTYEAK